MTILKHVGQVINTGKKCIIVFLKIPGREDHALIIDSESLPDRLHDPIMKILESPEGQSARNFGEVLGRRYSVDNNRTILEILHFNGYLRAEPNTNIYVVPRPNTKVLLKDMLEQLDMIEGKEVGVENSLNVEDRVSNNDMFVNNSVVDENEKNLEIAKGLLVQAELLEQEALQLRKKAYSFAPSLMKLNKNTNLKENSEEFKQQNNEENTSNIENSEKTTNKNKVRSKKAK